MHEKIQNWIRKIVDQSKKICREKPFIGITKGFTYLSLSFNILCT